MSSLPTPQSPTHAIARITATRFYNLLKEKNSPALPEALAIYEELVLNNVDPSFALGQYRVESQMGTAGYAVFTKSIGNMLFDSNLTILAIGQYSPGNGYTYAKYTNRLDATKDYCRYLAWYRDHYNLTTIYGATARWIGKTPGSPGHLSYVTNILSDMIKYETEGQFYETGDSMIYAGPALDRTTGRLVQKYPIKYGDILYRGTNGDILKKYTGTAGNAWWLGPVNGSYAWGAIFIGTSSADPDATLVYIKNPSKLKIINI